MYEDDYDGIIAGSPAVDFNNLYSWRASFLLITGSNTTSDFITATTWGNLIHKRILADCDTIDKVADGIIEDPTLCKFDPAELLCGPNATADNISPTSTNATCLTSTQVDTVRKVFSPLLSTNGSLVYPRMQPGSEILAAQGLYAGQSFYYSQEWFRYVVFSDPSWDPATFDPICDTALAERLNPANVRTWPSSLAAFRDRGGKFITFHGQQDQQITSFDTIRFYERLSKGMASSSSELDEFFRFFVSRNEWFRWMLTNPKQEDKRYEPL